MTSPYLEAAKAARHDRGKYMVFQLRWVTADGPSEDLEEALQADLLRTHEGPSGTVTAPGVWASVRGALRAVVPSKEVIQRLDAEMGSIEQSLPTLAGGGMAPEELRGLAQQALSFSEQLDALYQEAKEG